MPQMGCTITISSRKTHDVIKPKIATITDNSSEQTEVRKDKLTPRNWTSVVKAGGIGGGAGVSTLPFLQCVHFKFYNFQIH